MRHLCVRVKSCVCVIVRAWRGEWRVKVMEWSGKLGVES